MRANSRRCKKTSFFLYYLSWPYLQTTVVYSIRKHVHLQKLPSLSSSCCPCSLLLPVVLFVLPPKFHQLDWVGFHLPRRALGTTYPTAPRARAPPTATATFLSPLPLSMSDGRSPSPMCRSSGYPSSPRSASVVGRSPFCLRPSL